MSFIDDPETRRTRRLVAFHRAMDVPVREVPTIPPDGEVRLRLRLIAEEFVETLRGALYAPKDLDTLQVELNELVSKAEIDVEMTDFVDGLGDMDYVIEGTRLAFGIDGEPIEAEIHRANMAKLGGPRRADGKRLKPIGWKPPNIEGVLNRQGWSVIDGGKAEES